LKSHLHCRYKLEMKGLFGEFPEGRVRCDAKQVDMGEKVWELCGDVELEFGGGFIHDKTPEVVNCSKLACRSFMCRTTCLIRWVPGEREQIQITKIAMM
jgi:hypothetical protein